MRMVFVALASVLMLAAAAAAPARSPASIALAIDEAEALIAKGIDEARAELAPEAPKLVRNGELDRIARLRSEAIAKGVDPFAHEDSKGRQAATDMMRERVSPYGAFGENIMYEFHSRAPFNPQSFAKIAVEGWLDSPGHRANILAPHFDRSGIGVALNGTTAYATQVFMGPPRTAPRPERRPPPGQPGQLQ
jgi:uncharacterized protein YkwD